MASAKSQTTGSVATEPTNTAPTQSSRWGLMPRLPTRYSHRALAGLAFRRVPFQRFRPAAYARASNSKISALVLQRFISSSSLVIASCECRPARPRRNMWSRGTISAG